MCLLIVAITACNNFGNNPDENNTNEDNVESLVAASILNGLAPNIKIVYAISHDGLEYEITFFKVGNHFLLKKYDFEASKFGYYLAGYNEREHNWDCFSILEGDDAWERSDEYTNLTFAELLRLDLFYNLFYVFLDPEYKYLENSQLNETGNIELGNYPYSVSYYQYHDSEQGVIFFDIVDINGVMFCVSYTRPNFNGFIISYEVDFPLPDFELPAPPIEGIEDEGERDEGDGINYDILEKLPQSFKITVNATTVRNITDSPEPITSVEEQFIYKVDNNFLTQCYHPNHGGDVYHYYEYNPTQRRWNGYRLYPESDWDTKSTNLAVYEIFYPEAIPYTFDIFSIFSYSRQNYKDIATLVGPENITISGTTYVCNKYTYDNTDECDFFTFWITSINGVEHCLKYTASNNRTHLNREMKITAYETERVAFPAVTLPGEETGGGTGEEPGGGTGEEPGGGTGEEPESKPVPETDDEVLSTLPTNLKWVCVSTIYPDANSGQSISAGVHIYKNDYDFLVQDWGVTYIDYYRHNSTNSFWKGYRFDTYQPNNGWTERHQVTNEAALFHHNALKYNSYVFRPFSYAKPIYGTFSYIGTEDITIKFNSESENVTYTCDKFETKPSYNQYITLWIAEINGVRWCLKSYEVNNGSAYALEVYMIDTVNTDYPSDITLPAEEPGGEDPGGGTGEEPGGGTGEEPGGGTGEEPGGDTGEEPGGGTGEEPGSETPLTAEEIINGLSNTLRFDLRTTYTTDWYIDIQGYKIDNNFLFGKYENMEEGYIYYYYKYNEAENNWDEYFITPHDTEWLIQNTDRDALSMLTDLSYTVIRDMVRYMLWDFQDPNAYLEASYLYEDFTSITPGSKEISGTTYNYDEYYYYEYKDYGEGSVHEAERTFQLTTINGVKHCIYFTDGGDVFEVTGYTTSGVTFPDTHGIPLP